MTSTFLTSEEVKELTGRVQFSAQQKVLRSMGVEHRTRPDGSIAILRAHVEQLLGMGAPAKRKATAAEPDWSALDAART